MINIDYQHALDWGHCLDIHQAQTRLSEITKLLNDLLKIRQDSKKAILGRCSEYPNENFSKMSWDNKLERLSEVTGSTELSDLWLDADTAYRQLNNKQGQVLEDLMALKKIADITPR